MFTVSQKVICWGSNLASQLNEADTNYVAVPTLVSTIGSLAGKKIKRPVTGHRTLYYLDHEGTIHGRGQNLVGELGIGLKKSG